MTDGCGCKKVDGKCSNWKKNVKNICKQLDIYIEFVYDHEEEFLKKFAVAGCDLVNIYFSTERVKIYYLIENGQTITDSIEMDDFVTWMEETK
jgi:hypothetical protein